MHRIYFFCPFSPQPSGGIAVLLKFASILRTGGYSVHILYNPPFLNPGATTDEKIVREINLEWLDFPVNHLNYVALGRGTYRTDKGNRLTLIEGLSLEKSDVLVIPEGMPDVMRSAAASGCKKVVLAQSWSYILPGLADGVTWSGFGIHNVLTVGENIRRFVHRFMPEMDISVVRYSIDRRLFSPPSKKQKLITYTCRDGCMEFRILQAIKIFRLRNPHLNQYVFQKLEGLTRQQFAMKIRNSAFYVFSDDISGVPTAPLEAMACKTVPVGMCSYGSSEYANEYNGLWVDSGDVVGLGEELARVVNEYEKNEFDLKRFERGFEETLDCYKESSEKEGVIAYFDRIFRA